VITSGSSQTRADACRIERGIVKSTRQASVCRERSGDERSK